MTLFLLWIGTYCISCVVQQTSGVKDLSSLVRYDDSSLAAMRHVQSIIPVVRPRPNTRSHSVLLLVQSCQQPFYENYPTLDSRDTGPFTRQDGFQNRHKVYSVAYGSTKIEFLIFQNNRVFFASAFSSVQFKSNTECSVNSVF